MSATSFTQKKSVGSKGYTFLGPLETSRYRPRCFFTLKQLRARPTFFGETFLRRYGQLATDFLPSHLDIEVEGKIFAFGFSKKYNFSLLSIECRVLDRRRAFHRLACVDAHLCPPPFCSIPTTGRPPYLYKSRLSS
jgi:hypothetical protein